jgi:hypothetical protein
MLSAYKSTSTCPKIREISFTNQIKQSGPKWLPCGTLEETKISLETQAPILTRWILLTAGWFNISQHFIQEQTMTHLIKDPSSSYVGLNILFNANTIIVISKPMMLLIRTSNSSKIAQSLSQSHSLMSLSIMHHRSDSFIFLAEFVILFFNPFSSFVTHGSFWAQRAQVLGSNFSKQDHITL